MSARHLRLVRPPSALAEMNAYERGRREAGIPCIEFSIFGYRAVIINPDHPEYEELRSRNEAAADRLALWDFELNARRGLIAASWAWIRGTP